MVVITQPFGLLLDHTHHLCVQLSKELRLLGQALATCMAAIAATTAIA